MKTIIPTRLIGPVAIVNDYFSEEIRVPLATLETPLWFSVNRGARVTRKNGGIWVTIVQSSMSRSILLEAENTKLVNTVIHDLPNHRKEMEACVVSISQHTKLIDWHTQVVANLLYLRFSFFTGGAAGHNMSTKAAERLQQWLINKYPGLSYVSVSGNYCTDKKNSSVNGILGRGKYVVAELTISREICEDLLHTTPEKIVNLNIKKNLIGSIISGGVRTANAHFANMLLAFYLAMGQDAANLVEGSQGITHAEVREGNLYFSVTLPNIIVGAIGGNTNLKFIRDNLAIFKFMENYSLELQSSCLAIIAAAVVWCGELSLLASQAVPGELMRSHIVLERKQDKRIKKI